MDQIPHFTCQMIKKHSHLLFYDISVVYGDASRGK